MAKILEKKLRRPKLPPLWDCRSTRMLAWNTYHEKGCVNAIHSLRTTHNACYTRSHAPAPQTPAREHLSRTCVLGQQALAILFVLTVVEIRVMQKSNDVAGMAARPRSLRSHWTWHLMVQKSDVIVRSRVGTRHESLTNMTASEGVRTPLNTNV